MFPRVTRCKNLMSREMIFQYSQQSNCDSACCLVALVRAGRVRPQVYCIHAFVQIVFAFFSISNANVSDHLQFSLYMTLNLLQNFLGSSDCFRARVRLCDNLFSPVRFFRALVALSTYMHIYLSCDRIFKVRFGCVPSRFPFAWVARVPVLWAIFLQRFGLMRASVGRQGGASLGSRASRCGASQANGKRSFCPR